MPEAAKNKFCLVIDNGQARGRISQCSCAKIRTSVFIGRTGKGNGESSRVVDLVQCGFGPDPFCDRYFAANTNGFSEGIVFTNRVPSRFYFCALDLDNIVASPRADYEVTTLTNIFLP